MSERKGKSTRERKVKDSERDRKRVDYNWKKKKWKNIKRGKGIKKKTGFATTPNISVIYGTFCYDIVIILDIKCKCVCMKISSCLEIFMKTDLVNERRKKQLAKKCSKAHMSKSSNNSKGRKKIYRQNSNKVKIIWI